jgi:nucleoside-diphosphate-sugar epimerase
VPSALVCGGTGFLGSNLCRRLVAEGMHVVSLSRQSAATPVEGVDYRHGDITQLHQIQAALGEAAAFDYVINCGGNVDHSTFFSGGFSVIQQHYIGLMNLVQAIDRQSLRRFVQFGSSDEYGSLDGPQAPSMREEPRSAYSLAKTASTQLLQALWRADEFPAVSLRLFLAYGPGQPPNRFVPQVIAGARSGKPFPVSAGLQVRDFCFIDDVVDLVLRCLAMPGVNGKILNVGSGSGIRIRDFVELICTEAGGGKPEFGAIATRKNENMALVADLSETVRCTGWTPRTSILDGLKATMRTQP